MSSTFSAESRPTCGPRYGVQRREILQTDPLQVIIVTLLSLGLAAGQNTTSEPGACPETWLDAREYGMGEFSVLLYCL